MHKRGLNFKRSSVRLSVRSGRASLLLIDSSVCQQRPRSTQLSIPPG